MNREDLNDLLAFLVVAEERSFTRAAAKLGKSQSALSQNMKHLEERLGVRLLARTTRSVSTTEAGERLLAGLRPALEGISDALDVVSYFRKKPAGLVRISTSKSPAMSVVRRALARFLLEHPDVNVELTIDAGFVDIVEGRCDAGIRLGQQLDQDMVAVRISPDIRARIIGSPSYFANHPIPLTPHDLHSHNCISYRMTTLGGIYAWEFEKEGQELTVRVSGSLVTNDADIMVAAALDGVGIAFVLEGYVTDHLADGRLVSVLEDWCAPFPGFYLYYPSRKQMTPAFAALVEALRYRS